MRTRRARRAPSAAVLLVIVASLVACSESGPSGAPGADGSGSTDAATLDVGTTDLGGALTPDVATPDVATDSGETDVAADTTTPVDTQVIDAADTTPPGDAGADTVDAIIDAGDAGADGLDDTLDASGSDAVDDAAVADGDASTGDGESDGGGPADAGPTTDAADDAADSSPEDVFVPPVFACKKDGDCVLQFPDLPPCSKAACDLATGACGVAVLEDGAACSDGDPCSLDDHCESGVCTPLALNCDDGNACTDDTCFPGLGCVNLNNLTPCDDGDACTSSDHCQAGACTGTPKGCDDSDSCTADFCVEGSCKHQLSSKDGCCQVEVAAFQFDDGNLAGWLADNSSDKVGWTLSEARSVSFPAALYYGNVKSATYEAPEGASAGTITSQPIALPTAGVITLGLHVFLDVEPSSSRDKLFVYAITTDGQKLPMWHKTEASIQLGFVEVQADLTELTGQVVKIQLSFDTVDGNNNATEGVYVDDVTILASCEIEPCNANEDCDDALPCTFDSCDEDHCVHDVIPGCCTSHFECNDGNVCTTDTCANEQCAWTNNEKGCNDQDPCTIKDTCAEGTCAGESLVCDDGDPCTLDACANGSCGFTASEAPECCGFDVIAFGFDEGVLGGFEAVPAEGGFELTNARAATFPYSLHIGGGAGTIAGTVTSPQIALTLVPALELRFWVYLDTEPGADVDTVTITGISTKGKEVLLWEKPPDHPMKQWVHVVVDAGFFATESGVRLEVAYDSVDPAANDGEGVYIDAIELAVPCPPPPCDEATACDDGQASTADACVDGTCQSEPILWYCAHDPDCEDLKPCTEQSCTGGVCQILVTPGCCETAIDCDDGNACTTDICNGLDGCSHAPKEGPCDDGDGCTVSDTCADGVCVGAEKSCDDGTGCTDSLCSGDGECSYTFLANEGCCDKAEATFAFTDALAASGWTLTGTSTKVKWQLGHDKYTSGPSALYYGDTETQTYDDGKSSGTATSPPVWLPNAIVTSARFLLYLDVENDPQFDVLRVSVLAGEGEGATETEIWSKSFGLQMQAFVPMELSLAPWMGQTVRIRFSFDTVDGSSNNREGVIIDDLVLFASCPPPPCTTVIDCNDKNHCTTDKCVDGSCAHTTIAGCCETQEACNDYNFCTADACVNQFCAFTKIPGCCFNTSDCDDGNVCTTDQCDPEAGCKHVPNALFCTDGDPCTKSDQCKDGVCAGEPVVCDDGDDLCTKDVCKAGSCVFEPTSAPGCCEVAADCDDKDPCTEDACVDGICHSTNLCCQSDAECSDGDDVCTVDKCVDGDCHYQQTNAPGCCQPLVYNQPFAGVDPGGFLFQGTSTAAKWGVVAGKKNHSPPSALYYGNPATGTFDYGSTSGSATSPPIVLPNKPGLTLSFWRYMDTESGTGFDQLYVYALDGTSQSTVWTKASYPGMKVWASQTVSLDAFKGKTLKLQWFFNSVDSLFNSGEGVYVDDVRITVPCP